MDATTGLKEPTEGMGTAEETDINRLTKTRRGAPNKPEVLVKVAARVSPRIKALLDQHGGPSLVIRQMLEERFPQTTA